MEPSKDYVLIRNESEAYAEKLAVLTGKAEDLPSYLQSTTETIVHPHGFERLAERIPVPILATCAGGGQRDTGLARLRHGRRFPLSEQPGMRLSTESPERIASFTPIRRLPYGRVRQRPVLRRDQQQQRPAPSGRRVPRENGHILRPQRPTAHPFQVGRSKERARMEDRLLGRLPGSIRRRDCHLVQQSHSILGSNVTFTCPAGMEFATGVKRITTECLDGGRWSSPSTAARCPKSTTAGSATGRGPTFSTTRRGPSATAATSSTERPSSGADPTANSTRCPPAWTWTSVEQQRHLATNPRPLAPTCRALTSADANRSGQRRRPQYDFNFKCTCPAGNDMKQSQFLVRLFNAFSSAGLGGGAKRTSVSASRSRV